MTDQDQPITPDDSSTDGPETPAAAADTAPETPEVAKSREARQRVELRETRAKLERMQKAEVERHATGKLAQTSDVWLDGLTVDAVCDEDGDIDPAKVDEAIDALLAAHPHWAKPKLYVTQQRGLQSGATAPAVRTEPSWADALRPGRD